MAAYVLRRLLLAAPVLFGATLIAFTLGVVAPGDPAAGALMQSGFDAPTQAEIAAMRTELGLDRPLPVQYVSWLGNVLTGDFGTSIYTDRSVSEEFARRLPTTLALAASALVLAILIGLPSGLAMGYWAQSFGDRAGRVVALALLSVPGFWLALMLILVFAETLRWLPTSGLGSWRHMILPALVLSTGMAALLMRLSRAVMLEALAGAHITAARARGLAEIRVVLIHALKGAAAPLITVIGGYFGAILGGSVIVEVIFAIPGIGQYAVEGIFRRDYPVIQGYVLFTAAVYVVFNLAADVACFVVNPQLRLGARVA
ncbi:MAG: ABC transporter permease [Pseudomonadota bacterium]